MKRKKSKKKPFSAKFFCLFFILAALVVVYGPGCSPKTVHVPTSGKKAPKGTFKPYTIKGQTYHPLTSSVGFEEVGIASWYGPSFHGRRTSNGEVYNMEAMTAAHKILPMNTFVEVTNLSTGKKIRVRINDRGPFVDNRIIDLSKNAARKLNVLGPGTAKVRIVALGYKKPGSGKPGRPLKFVKPLSYKAGPFAIQVGAFSNESNAWRLAANLRVKWKKVKVIKFERGDKTYYRVWVGKIDNLASAQKMQKNLREQGFSNAFAVAW